MNTYSVYLPPNCNAEQEGSAVKFLVDGKSLLAILVPPAWLIWHRLWWGLGVYMALATLLLILVFTPLREAVPYLSVIPGLYLMLEGNELIRQRHERQGWQYLGVVQGLNHEDAELRYFELQALAPPHNKPAIPKSPDPVNIPTPATQSIGLFPLEN